MSKMSLADKLKVLVDVTSSSGMFIVAIGILIALAYVFVTTNKNNKKTSKKICLTVYGIITIGTLIFYGSSISDFFDYMMNNFFIMIYFPNLAIYFAAIITTNIILWISIFNTKITKAIKIINTILFSIIHYLLILIINIITTKKLDIFNQISVYQNKQAQALIELSSTIFMMWILFLIIYKVIRLYQSKDNTVEALEPLVKIVEVEKEVPRRLPTNVQEITPPYYVRGHKKVPVIEKPKVDLASKAFDGLLTIDDYRLLLSILKEYKEKESTSVAQVQQKEPEQLRFQDLQDLYRPMR